MLGRVGAAAAEGLDIDTLIATKEAKRGVASLPQGSPSLIAQTIVDAKTELEKIREQVQNVE